MTTPVDPWSETPYYRQVADAIRKRIEAGELAPYDPIPSEKTLTDTYAVSRDTARRAVAALRAEGLIFTLGTRGSYVSPRDDV